MKRLHRLCEWSSALVFVRRRWLLPVLFVGGLLLLVYQWGFICTNVHSRFHIENTCTAYASGQAVGNLCPVLCKQGQLSSISCQSIQAGKETVFSGKWDNTSIIFKSPEVKTVTGWIDDPNRQYPSEKEFLKMIKSNIELKFNMIINDVDAMKITYFQTNKNMYQRHIEMANVWSLLQDNEYLALALYKNYDIFPKLIGSCGSLFAVEKLNSITGYWHLISLYDSQHQWKRRVKIALMILKFLQDLETNLTDPLHICDVKMNNFGFKEEFTKIKYMDLDFVHPRSIANKITGDGSPCSQHSECDFFDCRSFCNQVTGKCQYGVVNNNLQIVCEKIFLGWVMSGRVILPGLLLGAHTPQSLVELLESCANPALEAGTPRAPASSEIHKRLKNYLTQLSLP